MVKGNSFGDVYRFDLLCLEGIAQALRIFNGQQEVPKYTLANISSESMLEMHVKKEVHIHTRAFSMIL